ncbi:MAG: TIGR02300 family protein [Alphaproteobacteria bacterium]|nr:TIGR02300 family protein [Alphaproteobacteria bacterium]MBM3642576.1 TIGR02300 family protein [Alphaproteobacteria bacterium]
MAKPELGAKRQCQSCGTKFYDLNKDPIACPKCGAIYQVVALTRSAARVVEEEESEVEKENAETVSLEEVEETETAAETIDVEDDVEIEASESEDDTFLEEEEGDDDVSGLIDGDIESDEES